MMSWGAGPRSYTSPMRWSWSTTRCWMSVPRVSRGRALAGGDERLMMPRDRAARPGVLRPATSSSAMARSSGKTRTSSMVRLPAARRAILARRAAASASHASASSTCSRREAQCSAG